MQTLVRVRERPVMGSALSRVKVSGRPPPPSITPRDIAPAYVRHRFVVDAGKKKPRVPIYTRAVLFTGAIRRCSTRASGPAGARPRDSLFMGGGSELRYYSRTIYNGSEGLCGCVRVTDARRRASCVSNGFGGFERTWLHSSIGKKA